MMQGIHWVVRTPDQLARLMQVLHDHPLPFQVKVSHVVHPKTAKQIRYAHSLCNSLAADRGVSPEAAKRDSKAAFGRVEVSTSIVTGDRTVRLVSFSDYSREEMEAFCTAMEVFLTEQEIPFVASE